MTFQILTDSMQNIAPTFDLRREKWIPIIRADGSREELGLEAALCEAHEWRAISDPLPTVEFGLYRLFVAFVLDIFEPKDSFEWAELWEKNAFNAERIRAYFDQHEGAFDLFGDKPFLQCPDMGGEKAKPLAGLLHSMPSGTNVDVFHHGPEDNFQLSPVSAARCLCAVSPFAIQGGKGYFTGINGSPPWYVMPLGTTGFETLLLNTPFLTDLYWAEGEEIPAWRSNSPILNQKLTSSSLLQSLTWRPRRVRLFAESYSGICSLSGKMSANIVRSMCYQPGEGADFDWVDPNVAYSTGQNRFPLKPRPGKEIWRDTGPIAFLKQPASNTKEDVTFQRPAIIDQISRLVSNRQVDGQSELHLAAYGLRCKEANIFEWQVEHLALPLPLLWEEAGQTQAQEAINLAENVGNVLERHIRLVSPTKPDKSKKIAAKEAVVPRNPKALQSVVV